LPEADALAGFHLGQVRIFAGGDRFVGIGEVLDDGRVAPRRLMNAG
jgi:tRNA pseudouridine55 synthase